MIKLVVDVDKKLRGRLNYLFASGRLSKIETSDGYLAYDTDEYDNIKYKKVGRKIKVRQSETREG